MERSVLLSVLSVYFGSRAHQQLDVLFVSMVAGVVKRGVITHILCINLTFKSIDEKFEKSFVSSFSGIMQNGKFSVFIYSVFVVESFVNKLRS